MITMVVARPAVYPPKALRIARFGFIMLQHCDRIPFYSWCQRKARAKLHDVWAAQHAFL